MSPVTISMLAITVGRLLTGTILLIAGSAKLRAGPNNFSKAILGYGLVPEKIAWVLAYCLPWLEVLSGGLLVVGFMTWLAAPLASALFLVFSMAIASSLLRGRDHDCGCAGRISGIKRLQWRLIYRNLSLIGILIAVYGSSGGALSLDRMLRVSAYDSLNTWEGLAGPAMVWLTALCATLLLHIWTRRKFVRTPSVGAR